MDQPEALLNDIQARVLACLMEKQITTPDYYPLTLNALTNACNQKSNRNPVMALDEQSVVRALEGLRKKMLAWRIKSTEFRVPKYEHSFDKEFSFTPAQTAIVCELLLRGPQTAGELRSRASRMHPMDMETVQQTLEELASMDDGPHVVRLPRAAGQKERRFTHLFCGAPDLEEMETGPADEKAFVQVIDSDERVARLEQEVEALKKELEELNSRFQEFAAQFD